MMRMAIAIAKTTSMDGIVQNVFQAFMIFLTVHVSLCMYLISWLFTLSWYYFILSACACNSNGTKIDDNTCNLDGQCNCRLGSKGLKCDECQFDYYKHEGYNCIGKGNHDDLSISIYRKNVNKSRGSYKISRLYWRL